MNLVNDLTDGAPLAQEAASQRGQSTIQFPYVHYEDALSVARAIHDVGGVPLTKDQLLAAMKDKGSFPAKLGGARQFGLVEPANGKYQLTQLAYSALDPDESRQRPAKASAFLHVPLFQKVYNEFRGRQLPPRPLGLENAFVGFGVAPKQKANARIAFDRSAKQCGFFPNEQQDRLVAPILGNSPDTISTSTSFINSPSPDNDGNSGRPAYSATIQTPVNAEGAATPSFAAKLLIEPLIRGMVERMPGVGEKWEMEKRRRWLQTFASNLELIYEPGDSDASKVIVVECKTATQSS